MDDIMIRAKDLSMMFNLGIDKGFSLKQGFVDPMTQETYEYYKGLKV